MGSAGGAIALPIFLKINGKVALSTLNMSFSNFWPKFHNLPKFGFSLLFPNTQKVYLADYDYVLNWHLGHFWEETMTFVTFLTVCEITLTFYHEQYSTVVLKTTFFTMQPCMEIAL